MISHKLGTRQREGGWPGVTCHVSKLYLTHHCWCLLLWLYLPALRSREAASSKLAVPTRGRWGREKVEHTRKELLGMSLSVNQRRGGNQEEHCLLAREAGLSWLWRIKDGVAKPSLLTTVPI